MLLAVVPLLLLAVQYDPVSAGKTEETGYLINSGPGTEFVPVVSFKGRENNCASGMLWKGWEDDSAWCTLKAEYSRQEEDGVPFQRVTVTTVTFGRCQFTRGIGGIRGKQYMLLMFKARASHVMPVVFGIRMNDAPYEFHWESMMRTGRKWAEYTRLVELDAADESAGLYFFLPGLMTFDIMDVSLTKLDRKEAKKMKKAMIKKPAKPKPRLWKKRMRGVTVDLRRKEDDVEDLLKWNVNFVRVHLRYGDLVEVTPPYKFREEGFEKLDDMLNWCEKRGIRCLLDLHGMPGKRDVCEEKDRDLRIWEDFRFHDLLVETWKKLANRYVNRGDVVAGYDLLNEPNPGNFTPGSPADWYALVRRLIAVIRETDRDTPIIVEPTAWGGVTEYAFMPEFDDPRIIYSLHYYQPHEITHQGVAVVGQGDTKNVRYPGKVPNGTMWDRKKMLGTLSQVFEFQDRTGAEMYAGEFSCIRWAPGDTGVNWLRDFVDIMEERGIHWTYHAFREYDGWSLEHPDNRDDTDPDTDNGRYRLMMKYFLRNAK